jgi:hypothetical protein
MNSDSPVIARLPAATTLAKNPACSAGLVPSPNTVVISIPGSM